MSYLFLTIFALLPSFIWLLFYLRKDVHPESNWMVLKVFFYGMLVAFPAAFVEMGISEGFSKLNLSYTFATVLKMFVAVALIEEVLKYLVVKEKVLSDPEFDEPLDTMLYMIIAALGFGALENILILLPIGANFIIEEALFVGSVRFVGATFLHALSSGVLGYFLALSFFETKKRLKLLFLGLGIAVILHGLYNFSIIILADTKFQFVIPVIILVSLALALSKGSKELRQMASVCKIK